MGALPFISSAKAGINNPGSASISLPTADLFVVAGQSNAQVNVNTTLANVPAYIVSDAGVQSWDHDTAQFVTYGAGTNSLQPTNQINAGGGVAGNWGPEAEFSYRMRQATPSRNIYLVKYAIGSTKLFNDGGPCWDPAAGSYFSFVETTIAAAKAALIAQGFAPKVRLIIWMQGEADEGNSTMDAAYLTNLTALVAAMRTRWGDGATKLIIGRIIPAWAGSFTGVRSAQVTIGNSNPGFNYWLNCDGFSQNGAHYDATGTPQFGRDNFYHYTLGETQRLLNGTFPSLTSWVAQSWNGSVFSNDASVASVAGGVASLINSAGHTVASIVQQITGLTIGATYKVGGTVTRADNVARLQVTTDPRGLGTQFGAGGVALYDSGTIGTVTVDGSFVATATSHFLGLFNYSTNTSGTDGWSNVTVTGP